MERSKESLISIIIPVYNTPFEHMKANIDSILAQKFNSYEVVLVDDGSREECAKALDEFAKRDSRIRVIHQKNCGVSNARNTGIRNAKSPYIAFVDADDVIPENFLEEASGYIQEYAPDIIFGTLEYVPKRDVKQSVGCVEKFENESIDDVKLSLLGIKPRRLDYVVLGTPCARIYRTELAQKALFPEGVPLCEDQIFNRRILNEASKVLVVPKVWYYYIQNDFSAMHKTMKKSYYKMAKPYWDELFVINKAEKERIKAQLRIIALGLYYTVIKKDYIGKSVKLSQKIKELKEIAKHPLLEDAVANLQYSTENLKTGQKFGLFLMKHKLILAVYLFQLIKNRNAEDRQ